MLANGRWDLIRRLNGKLLKVKNFKHGCVFVYVCVCVCVCVCVWSVCVCGMKSLGFSINFTSLCAFESIVCIL